MTQNEMIIKAKHDEAIKCIEAEYLRASSKFGKFASPYEVIGIIREEYLELENEVFNKKSDINHFGMRKEAIQLGAMALRILIDCC